MCYVCHSFFKQLCGEGISAEVEDVQEFLV